MLDQVLIWSGFTSGAMSKIKITFGHFLGQKKNIFGQKNVKIQKWSNSFEMHVKLLVSTSRLEKYIV